MLFGFSFKYLDSFLRLFFSKVEISYVFNEKSTLLSLDNLSVSTIGFFIFFLTIFCLTGLLTESTLLILSVISFLFNI